MDKAILIIIVCLAVVGGMILLASLQPKKDESGDESGEESGGESGGEEAAAIAADPLGNTDAVLAAAKRYYDEGPGAGTHIIKPRAGNRVSNTHWDIMYAYFHPYKQTQQLGIDWRLFAFDVVDGVPVVTSMGARHSGTTVAPAPAPAPGPVPPAPVPPRPVPPPPSDDPLGDTDAVLAAMKRYYDEASAYAGTHIAKPHVGNRVSSDTWDIMYGRFHTYNQMQQLNVDWRRFTFTVVGAVPVVTSMGAWHSGVTAAAGTAVPPPPPPSDDPLGDTDAVLAEAKRYYDEVGEYAGTYIAKPHVGNRVSSDTWDIMYGYFRIHAQTQQLGVDWRRFTFIVVEGAPVATNMGSHHSGKTVTPEESSTSQSTASAASTTDTTHYDYIAEAFLNTATAIVPVAIQYYNETGPWAGHLVATAINGAQVSLNKWDVKFQYGPAPGSGYAETGIDWRRFTFGIVNGNVIVTHMGSAKSGVTAAGM